MNEVFELTQKRKDWLEADIRLHICGLYQQMLFGDKNAEQQLEKICSGMLVLHRHQYLSSCDEALAKGDINHLIEHYDYLILESFLMLETSAGDEERRPQ